ncbi:4Fe-4S dicluster domain-containing protein [Chloroflexota bacterium]
MLKRYGIVVDLKRCVGCNTCVIACKTENNVPLGLGWLRVLTHGGPQMDTPSGIYPHLSMEFIPISCQHCCQHCNKPPCVLVCPTGASYKREDGLVLIDWDKCIGCRYCMIACPYKARMFNQETPAQEPSSSISSAEVPEHQRGVVEKCTLCVHRIDKGEEPACVECCPTRARYFGDFNDHDSQASKLLRSRTSSQLLEELGTEPSMFFLR